MYAYYSELYRAVSQFFDAFENNSNFGQKVLTGTDFRSKFVKKLLSHNIYLFSETATKDMKSY